MNNEVSLVLQVKNGRFLKDGKPFFYLADTCWSAFTNITASDWNYYLDFRKIQGFNAIQINILQQWDASSCSQQLYPFDVTFKDDGSYIFDYSKINESYFDHACSMLHEMQKRNMIPVLALLWSNYVPDTWAAKIAKNNLFPAEFLENYVTYAVKRFKKYEPIYFVSGDTDFPTSNTIAYYRTVLDVLKKNDSQALRSFHIKGRLEEIPEEFSEASDFFSYQSGHNSAGQSTAYTIPFSKRRAGLTKPIVNTEPCYEQISYSRNQYGRYSQKDVRQAVFSSVLSGADAGVTYGAHGIWSWHHAGADFGLSIGEGFDTPFDWHDALHFPGASDLQIVKKVIEKYFPMASTPLDLSTPKTTKIRAAFYKNNCLIYLPTNTALDLSSLNVNRNNSKIFAFDLEKRIPLSVNWAATSQLQLLSCLSDALIIVNKLGGFNHG